MNFRLLAEALEHYQDRGYVYVDDVSWHVSHAAYYATKPIGAKDVRVQVTYEHDRTALLGDSADQFLVASGEQSFLQMMLDGAELKRAVCLTPCFRAEPRVDTLHRTTFMKVELINAHDTDKGHLLHMVHEAASFFEKHVPIRIVEVGDAFDIVEKSTRFELGSYGIRERDIAGRRFRWIYGTGCAEPRLSTAISRFSRVSGR